VVGIIHQPPLFYYSFRDILSFTVPRAKVLSLDNHANNLSMHITCTQALVSSPAFSSSAESSFLLYHLERILNDVASNQWSNFISEYPQTQTSNTKLGTFYL
jgi:hypothetical protein